MKKLFISAIATMIIAMPVKDVNALDTYKVAAGDTLWGISNKTNISIENIKNWNNLSSNALSIGQILNLSATTKISNTNSATKYHIVKSGDTLWNISVKYDVSMDDIITWNNMNSTVLKLEQRLIVGVQVEEQATTKTDLHLRETASSLSKSLLVMPKGSTVKVLEKNDSWWKLEYNGKIGYSSKEYLELKTGSENVSHIYINKVSGLFKEPGKEFLGAMKPATVEVLKVGTNGWYQIKTWLGSAWVKNGVLEEEKALEPTINYIYISSITGLFKEPGKTFMATMKPAKVQVVQKGEDGWYKVKTWLGDAWVKNGVTKETVTETFAKTTANLNLRENSSGSSKIILTMPIGSKVKILSTSSTWWKLEYNGKIGYASSEYLVKISSSVETSVTPNGKIILIDPGHGASDSGARGVTGTVYEKNINLAFSLKTKTNLEKMGYKVILTRKSDAENCYNVFGLGEGSDKSIDLDCRVKLAEREKADIFVSIHSNSIGIAGVTGTETYYNASTYNGETNPYPAQSKKLMPMKFNSYPLKTVVKVIKGINRTLKTTTTKIHVRIKIIKTTNKEQRLIKTTNRKTILQLMKIHSTQVADRLKFQMMISRSNVETKKPYLMIRFFLFVCLFHLIMSESTTSCSNDST